MAAKTTKAQAPAPKAKKAKDGGKPSLMSRIKAYFKAVRSELKRVVWPSKQELLKYTLAVLGMLLFFGILIALVDTAILPVLSAFSGLRG